MNPVVTETDRRDFDRHGFVVLESVIDSATLDILREECAVFVARTDAWLDDRSIDTFGITHRGKRYFIPNRYRDSDRMRRFVYGEAMRAITTAFLGDTVSPVQRAVGREGCRTGHEVRVAPGLRLRQLPRSRQHAPALPDLLDRSWTT